MQQFSRKRKKQDYRLAFDLYDGSADSSTMSASPMARHITETKSIPTKRVQINDPNELPSHYSSTPGGTLYSTTPGGTKIVYEKTFLLNLRNSPIAKTPPTYGIPEALLPGSKNTPPKNNYNKIGNNLKRAPFKQRTGKPGDDEQFHMEL